ncbi:hypothetical protein [Flavobacterium gelatinilyticum]|uniref:hypothetical protein n=1 Tax=Flavobacterium gelatinilyticum TaxID=3003260 RepID=UPI00248144B0|nr:hypothetical protein [Flavobacterium gelatinilyticum]
MEKTIWHMGLHEVLEISSNTRNAVHEHVSVRRVSGGWIYSNFYTNTENGQIHETSVFVPYSVNLKGPSAKITSSVI